MPLPRPAQATAALAAAALLRPLAAALPVPPLLALGRALGRGLYRTARGRRHVARVNLALCLPELDGAGREALLRRHFEALGEGLVEQALAWWAPPGRLAARAQLLGLEHLDRALAAGRGALLVSPHFTTVEIAGRLLAQSRRLHFNYRPHKSPAVEALQRAARLRHAASLVRHDDLRAVVRLLRRGEAVWYAPDQNYRGKQSAFVPFFGVPASTITATSRLARLTGAAVLPTVGYRLPGGRWRVVVEPPLAGFPGPDPAADAARLNAVFERQIRAAPEQYLWVHRRFKTRPPGEEDVYARPA